MSNNETKVWFNLWAVLGFILVMCAIGFTYLNAEQGKTKEKQQEIAQKVKVLEMQYEHIIKGLDKLTTSVEKVADKVEVHTRETRSNTAIKKWNDIK